MTYRSSLMALVMLAVATTISTAQTQSADVAKVSPEHIRSVTGKVDGDAIRANARTTRDWLSYGLDMPRRDSAGSARSTSTTSRP